MPHNLIADILLVENSLMQQCEQFIHEHNMVPANQPFFSQTPHPKSASCIIAWILDK